MDPEKLDRLRRDAAGTDPDGAIRRPSIGDDGAAVLAHVDGLLPDWTEMSTLAALQAHGYAAGTVLTLDGIALAERWAAIRADTTAASRPYGPLTEPTFGEIAEARGLPDRNVPLHWPYGRPTP